MTEENDRLRSYEIVMLRGELDLSQTDFGKMLGVSVRTVRGWEGGAVIPDSAQFTLRLVRHAMAFPLDDSAARRREWHHGLNTLLGRGQ